MRTLPVLHIRFELILLHKISGLVNVHAGLSGLLLNPP